MCCVWLWMAIFFLHHNVALELKNAVFSLKTMNSLICSSSLRDANTGFCSAAFSQRKWSCVVSCVNESSFLPCTHHHTGSHKLRGIIYVGSWEEFQTLTKTHTWGGESPILTLYVTPLPCCKPQAPTQSAWHNSTNCQEIHTQCRFQCFQFPWQVDSFSLRISESLQRAPGTCHTNALQTPKSSKLKDRNLKRSHFFLPSVTRNVIRQKKASLCRLKCCEVLLLFPTLVLAPKQKEPHSKSASNSNKWEKGRGHVCF